jgi:hypothetical protein
MHAPAKVPIFNHQLLELPENLINHLLLIASEDHKNDHLKRNRKIRSLIPALAWWEIRFPIHLPSRFSLLVRAPSLMPWNSARY